MNNLFDAIAVDLSALLLSDRPEQTLFGLESKGVFLVCVSNLDRRETRRILRDGSLLQYFDRIDSWDDINPDSIGIVNKPIDFSLTYLLQKLGHRRMQSIDYLHSLVS